MHPPQDVFAKAGLVVLFLVLEKQKDRDRQMLAFSAVEVAAPSSLLE